MRDHGPGFNEEHLHQVFDRFYRAEEARRMPGSGLGLAIVKQAAEAHGGWAVAANAPDGGAVLRISFGPTTGAAEPTEPEAAASATTRRHARTLSVFLRRCSPGSNNPAVQLGCPLSDTGASMKPQITNPDEGVVGMRRRESLIIVGGIAGAALWPVGRAVAAMTKASSADAIASAAATCVLTPEVTAGPYYIANHLFRRNITENQPGLPLALHLEVQSSTTCKPIEGANVEIWHANATGVYSGYGSGSTPGGGGGQATPTNKLLSPAPPAPVPPAPGSSPRSIPGCLGAAPRLTHLEAHVGRPLVHTAPSLLPRRGGGGGPRPPPKTALARPPPRTPPRISSRGGRAGPRARLSREAGAGGRGGPREEGVGAGPPGPRAGPRSEVDALAHGHGAIVGKPEVRGRVGGVVGHREE